MKSYIKDYPRPQLVRKNWKNLNGEWAFLFDDENVGEKYEWYATFPTDHREIQVPFTYETKLSGIDEQEHHENIWYNRVLKVDAEELENKKVILHFEGSDFHTKVWVNGIFVGNHKGGYARFSFDITNYVSEGVNDITVKVEDSKSLAQPRGKQRWMNENFECWYVQTTGIWKTVWVETVSETYLTGLKMTPDLSNKSIDVTYEFALDKAAADKKAANQQESFEHMYVETTITYKDTFINKSIKVITRDTVCDSISVNQRTENQWGIHRWSPENPALYDMQICIIKDGIIIDEVQTYFGMREIKIEKGNIVLNGNVLYQRLILDQGYWEDSHLTPPSEEALIEDIDKIHALGFNGLRKHMKTEDERFLYWCDVKGMLVWSEMAAYYEFDDKAVEHFTKEWTEVVRQNYNHPSIITWTPFNESWGVPEIKTNRKQQHFTESIYYLTKSIDDMRPVVVNDGWEHTVSDIITLHDYEEDGDAFFERYGEHLDEIMSGERYFNFIKTAFADGYEYKGQPIIISEYGGIAFSSGVEGEWGYGNMVTSEEVFLKRYDKITTAIKNLPYAAGFCYTQVSDVQQEINGLMTADRKFKIEPEKIREINCRTKQEKVISFEVC